MNDRSVPPPTGSAAPEGQGSTDEAIGRPGPWREGRYEQDGKPVPKSVVDPSQEQKPAPDTVSTPVTLDDYTTPKPLK